jgi:hypothetical protein
LGKSKDRFRIYYREIILAKVSEAGKIKNHFGYDFNVKNNVTNTKKKKLKGGELVRVILFNAVYLFKMINKSILRGGWE